MANRRRRSDGRSGAVIALQAVGASLRCGACRVSYAAAESFGKVVFPRIYPAPNRMHPFRKATLMAAFL